MTPFNEQPPTANNDPARPATEQDAQPQSTMPTGVQPQNAPPSATSPVEDAATAANSQMDVDEGPYWIFDGVELRIRHMGCDCDVDLQRHMDLAHEQRDPSWRLALAGRNAQRGSIEKIVRDAERARVAKRLERFEEISRDADRYRRERDMLRDEVDQLTRELIEARAAASTVGVDPRPSTPMDSPVPEEPEPLLTIKPTEYFQRRQRGDPEYDEWEDGSTGTDESEVERKRKKSEVRKYHRDARKSAKTAQKTNPSSGSARTGDSQPSYASVASSAAASSAPASSAPASTTSAPGSNTIAARSRRIFGFDPPVHHRPAASAARSLPRDPRPAPAPYARVDEVDTDMLSNDAPVLDTFSSAAVGLPIHTVEDFRRVLDAARVNHEAAERARELVTTAQSHHRNERTPLQQAMLQMWGTVRKGSLARDPRVPSSYDNYRARVMGDTPARGRASGKSKGKGTAQRHAGVVSTAPPRPNDLPALPQPQMSDNATKWQEFWQRYPEQTPTGVSVGDDGRPVLASISAYLLIRRCVPPEGPTEFQKHRRSSFIQLSIGLFSIPGLFVRILAHLGRDTTLPGSNGVARPFDGSEDNLTIEDVVLHYADCGYSHGQIKAMERFALGRRNTVLGRPITDTSDWPSYPTRAGTDETYGPSPRYPNRVLDNRAARATVADATASVGPQASTSTSQTPSEPATQSSSLSLTGGTIDMLLGGQNPSAIVTHETEGNSASINSSRAPSPTVVEHEGEDVAMPHVDEA